MLDISSLISTFSQSHSVSSSLFLHQTVFPYLLFKSCIYFFSEIPIPPVMFTASLWVSESTSWDLRNFISIIFLNEALYTHKAVIILKVLSAAHTHTDFLDTSKLHLFHMWRIHRKLSKSFICGMVSVINGIN